MKLGLALGVRRPSGVRRSAIGGHVLPLLAHLWVAWCLVAASGCALYDDDLLGKGTGGAGAGGSTGGAGAGAGSSGADAGVAGDAGMSGPCEPGPDESCPWICPEICNGVDDDCDGEIDGAQASAACELPHAAAVCDEGSCRLAMCDGTRGNCDGDDTNGCEADLHSLDTCRLCGQSCAKPHAVMTCEGTCEFVECEQGFADCNDDVSDGCETSIRTLTDCGECGHVCASIGGATPSCASGECQQTGCREGYAQCDGDPSNGCEPLDTPAHCGDCDTRCEGETAFCNGTSCTGLDCTTERPGFGDCDADSDTGCETELNQLDHCGACHRPCSFATDVTEPHASLACTDGSCGIDSCDPGFADCDGDYTNGCETPTTTVDDCGQCGRTCDLSHANAVCSVDSCEIDACDSGWADCNGQASDGCEQRLDTSSHCGACGNACDVELACVNGECGCPEGLTSCNGECVDTTRDRENCGECGVVCDSLVSGPICCAGIFCAWWCPD